MGIIRDFNNGRMEALRSISYSETGTQSPYVTNEPSVLNSLTSFFPDEISRRIDDTSRIAQMLVDKPGLKWIGNQTLLSREELERKAREAAKAKRGEGGTGAGQVLAGFAAAAGQVLKIVGSTVAQVPVNGTGTHFLRGFKTDTYLQPAADPNNPDGPGPFAQFFGAGGVEGAPLALEGQPIILDGNPQTGLNSFPVSDDYQISINNPDNPKELGLGDIVKNKYFVDPLSEVFNIPPVDTYIQNDKAWDLAQTGQTIIGDNEGKSGFAPKPPSALTGSISKYQSNLNADNTDLLQDTSKGFTEKVDVSKEGSFEQTERETKLVDFRKLKNRGYRTNTYSLDYSGAESSKIIKEVRVGLGNQGKKKVIGDNYTDPDKDRVDKINALDIQSKAIDGAEEARDLISLNFRIITPEQSYFLYFRAFLDQFSDSLNADWSSTKYIGRAEDFYTYNGFSRQVTIGFKIAAASRSEIKPLYRKMSTLASVVAPTYGGSESRFMRGTIAEVTVGDYLYKEPGIIDSVDFNWQTDYPWEINMRGPEGQEDTMPVVPHLLDCTVSFKPIHKFLPTAGIEPFILNNPAKRIIV